LTAGDMSSDEARIDVSVVSALVAAQFPEWAELPVAPVGKPGVDNATYRLGDEMSVRLPRFERWVGQVFREHEWLPVLAPQLPLAVSVPLAQGEPGEGYPFPWSVYKWLDGDAAGPEALTDSEESARELAAFVAAFQRVDPTGGPPPGWSNGFRGVPMGDDSDSPIVESRVRPKIAALDGLYDVAALTEVWEAALAAPAWDGPPVWIHGDPAPGNILLQDGRFSAVIDFGTIAVGDPACDLIAAWNWFPTRQARDIYRADLKVDDATWTRGRGWGLVSTLPAPADLAEDADPARATQARRRLDALVEDCRRN